MKQKLKIINYLYYLFVIAMDIIKREKVFTEIFIFSSLFYFDRILITMT